MFRKTGLDDARHVDFARRFGELDDVKPYNKAGRKHRLAFDELFDVSNQEADGSVADPNSHRAAFNKVFPPPHLHNPPFLCD
jgi:alpha-ketoglutarate-dependent 2,4-dichlorophenoxyacetate dioxygenase